MQQFHRWYLAIPISPGEPALSLSKGAKDPAVYRSKRTAFSLLAESLYGYTIGMKTAVSIPDDIFKGAERLARRTRKTRSRLFSDALKEYLARHAPDEVTEAMNRVCTEVKDTKDTFVSSASRRILERSEW